MELVVILVVALLIFGKRVPDIARRLGQSINEFKKGMKETTAELEKQPESAPPADQIAKKS